MEKLLNKNKNELTIKRALENFALKSAKIVLIIK
jgi:hypothetical protein